MNATGQAPHEQLSAANKRVGLKTGILIIGSLFWDTAPARQLWRQQRLSMTDARLVWLPIRYGRLSTSRSNTHTMVFSTLRYRRKQLGNGWIIPCMRDVKSFADLQDEVTALANAEGLSSWTWGAVALLRNPSSDIPVEIMREWRQYFTLKTRDCRVFARHLKSEWPALGKTGVLRIHWPKPVQQHFEVDLLLSAATEPSLISRTKEVFQVSLRRGNRLTVCESKAFRLLHQ